MNIKEQVNKSGFPLQLAIANEVTTHSHSWKVLYEEHGWKSESSEGFIDLMIEDQHKTWLMNIECKRVQDSAWIFLVDKKAPTNVSRAKIWATYHDTKNVITCFDWVEVDMKPICTETKYCVVPGQDSRAMPMLERTSATLVQSTEALAKEEATSLDFYYSGLRMYQNVIVTTAEINTCHIDVGEIDLATGKIAENTELSVVPFVKFRKQLGSTVKNIDKAQHDVAIRNNISSRESTIFVVNAAHFLDFLNQSELSGNINNVIRGAR